jgi:hypothetical protein
MISIDRSSSSGTLIGIVLAVVVGAGVAWWWFGDHAETAGAPAQGAASSAAMGATPGGGDTLPRPVGLAGDASVDNDPGLKSALSKDASGEQELKRVTSFLRFQRMFEKYQEFGQDAKDVAAKRDMAQQLVELLPERVGGAELSYAEGLLLCSVFLETLEADEAKRTARLTACGEQLEKVAPKTETDQQAKEVACRLEYRRRESALVAEYQSDSPATRDPVKLEKALEKAKQEVFNSPTCGT